MDPFTVTGLALGIAPLIISAVENYEHTFQPFVTYCRYSREIDNFTTRLGAQKAIFNNQCQLLLSGANGDIDHEDATLERILSDPNHTSRRSERLNSRLEALLGNSLSACESTLRLTQRTLKDIMHDTKSFQKVLQQKVVFCFILSRERRRTVKCLVYVKVKLKEAGQRERNLLPLSSQNEDYVRQDPTQ